MTPCRLAALRARVLAALVCLLMAPAIASAQTAGAFTRHLEVSAGAGVMGGSALGEQPATLRTAGSGVFDLFNAETNLAKAALIEGRVGYRLTRRYAIEGRAALSRPELRTTLSGDVENAAGVIAVQRVDRYIFDGGVRVDLEEGRFLHLTPFAAAGAGYVRQLHEGRTLGENGAVYYAGGGVTHAFFTGGRGFVRSAAFRADLRLCVFSSSVSSDDRSRPQGTASAGIALAF
jgi:hypothetical protein